MPVVTPIIQAQLNTLFSNTQNQPNQVAQQLILAIVNGCSSLFKVMGTSTVSFTPVGMNNSIFLLFNLFSNSQNQSFQVAQQIANAISLLDPTIPQTGLVIIQNILNSLFSNSQNQSFQVAQQIANAVQTYFSSSGICI